MGGKLSTSWSDARSIFAEKEGLIILDDSLIVLRSQNIDIGIRSDKSQTYVDEVSFDIWPDNDPKILASTVVALFGSPCNVTITLIENQMIDKDIHCNCLGGCLT